jgi:hypothetical protein
VLCDGKVISRHIPVTVRVPAGKYEVSVVQEGRPPVPQIVEVKELETIPFTVGQEP